MCTLELLERGEALVKMEKRSRRALLVEGRVVVRETVDWEEGGGVWEEGGGVWRECEEGGGLLVVESVGLEEDCIVCILCTLSIVLKL